MLNAIREARVRRRAAKVKIRLAGVADRPFADPVIEIEQPGLVRDFGTRLCRDEPPGRRRRDWCLLFARSLSDKASGADGTVLHLLRARALRRCSGGLGWGGARLGSRHRSHLGSFRPGGGRLGSCRSRRRLSSFLLFTGLYRGRALFETEAVSFADHRVATDASKLVCDLARSGTVVPHFLQALDALFSPRHY